MPRRITPGTSVDNLKREAKRWLQALRAGEPGARGRFERAFDAAPAFPGLRHVQHALAHHPALRDDPLALGEAVMRHRADAVEILLDVGVSVEVTNADGERPLHIAAWSDALDVARLLIERGPEVDSIRGNYHNTALGAAVHFRLNTMIDLLSTVSRDIWGLIYVGKTERVRGLVAEDPALARVRTSQQTPLMWLPVDDEYCAIELARLLLAHGADPTVANPDGLTAAELAERIGMHTLAGVLRMPAV